MGSDNFDRAFEYLLKDEGGFVNNPNDSGGAAKYGITKATLTAFRARPVTDQDVADLPRDEAKAIYRASYWNRLNLDSCEKLVSATAIFDAAVLFGVVLAAVRSQKVLLGAGLLTSVDGVFGPATLGALNQMDEKAFVVGFQVELTQRINEIIRSRPKDEAFRDGWENRVARFTTMVA